MTDMAVAADADAGTLVSSRATWAYKLAFLLFFVGLWAFALVVQLYFQPYPNPPVFLGTLAAGPFALWLWWASFGSLADRVEDHGDRLVAHRYGRTWSIPMAQVVLARAHHYRAPIIPSRLFVGWRAGPGRGTVLAFLTPIDLTRQWGDALAASIERRSQSVRTTTRP